MIRLWHLWFRTWLLLGLLSIAIAAVSILWSADAGRLPAKRSDMQAGQQPAVGRRGAPGGALVGVEQGLEPNLSDRSGLAEDLGVEFLARDGVWEDVRLIVLSEDEVYFNGMVTKPGQQRLVGRDEAGWIVVWSEVLGVRAIRANRLRGTFLAPEVGDGMISGSLVGGQGVILAEIGFVAEPGDASLSAMGPGVLASLEALGINCWTRTIAIDSDGSFSLRGLASTWSGRVKVGLGYCLGVQPELGRSIEYDHGRPFALRLSEPSEHLNLVVERSPMIWGNVVWDDTGAPVAKASLRFSASTHDSPGCPPVKAVSNQKGHFEVVLPASISIEESAWWAGAWRESLSEILIEASHPDSGVVFVVASLENIGVNGYVGEVRLVRGVEGFIQVSDSNGQGLSGSVAVFGGRTFVADSEGVISLRGYVPSTAVEVGALGYARAHFQFSLDDLQGPEPHEVTLLPGTELTVKVIDMDGLSAEGVSLAVTGVNDFLDESAGWPSVRLHDKLSPSRIHGINWDNDEVYVAVKSGEEGEFVILGFRAGTSLHLVVKDPSGYLLLESNLASPEVGIPLVKTLRVPVVIGRVHGVVADASGRPVFQASIELHIGERTFRADTDTDGRYRLPGMALPLAEGYMLVQHPEYAPVIVELATVGADGRIPDISLDKGHRVRVSVADSTGLPLTDLDVVVESRGALLGSCSPLEGGEYLYLHAPNEEVEIVVYVGFDRYASIAHPGSGEVSIEIPVVGYLDVFLLDGGEPPEAGSWRTLNAISLDRPTEVKQAPFRKESGGLFGALALAAGRYRVFATWMVAGPNGIEASPLGDSKEFTVTAGQHLVVDL